MIGRHSKKFVIDLIDVAGYWTTIKDKSNNIDILVVEDKFYIKIKDSYITRSRQQQTLRVRKTKAIFRSLNSYARQKTMDNIKFTTFYEHEKHRLGVFKAVPDTRGHFQI